jgi:hypothetical protein
LPFQGIYNSINTNWTSRAFDLTPHSLIATSQLSILVRTRNTRRWSTTTNRWYEEITKELSNENMHLSKRALSVTNREMRIKDSEMLLDDYNDKKEHSPDQPYADIPTTDNPDAPSLTFRVMFMGTVWAVFLGSINSVLSLRTNGFGPLD